MTSTDRACDSFGVASFGRASAAGGEIARGSTQPFFSSARRAARQPGTVRSRASVRDGSPPFRAASSNAATTAACRGARPRSPLPPRRSGEAPGAGRGGRRRPGAPQADGQGGPDHLADRMVVVVRGPHQQAQQRRRNRRLVVEPLGDPEEPLGIDLGLVRRLENHSRAHRAAERDLHPHAGPQGAGTGLLVGRQVLEPAPDRPRHRDSENPRHRCSEELLGRGRSPGCCPMTRRPRWFRRTARRGGPAAGQPGTSRTARPGRKPRRAVPCRG